MGSNRQHIRESGVDKMNLQAWVIIAMIGIEFISGLVFLVRGLIK